MPVNEQLRRELAAGSLQWEGARAMFKRDGNLPPEVLRLFFG